MDLADLARRYCLQNAIQHDGQCNPKSLVGRIMGAHAEFRSDPGAVAQALMLAGAAVNAMDVAAQQAELAAAAPELLETKKKERRTGLKPLPGADDAQKVVLRFAPNPNGPLSLGHGRGVAIMSQYARDYDADLILRFDDTDPAVKPPLYDPDGKGHCGKAGTGIDGYAWIAEDFEWLGGLAPTRVIKASDRLPVYYQHARHLIDTGNAYVCTCDPTEWRELKNQGTACPCRSHDVAAVHQRFSQMVGPLDVDPAPAGAEPTSNLFEAGAAVVRVKTDIQHKDPALRDWPAWRIVAASAIHPREAAGEIPHYRCWPLLDFESAVEDHLQGVTHIIRGKDLMDSTRKQEFLYKHLGWKYPQTLYWGRVSVHEFGKFSTSMMRKGIEDGDFAGWDDIRLPTLRALRRRGFSGDALRKFWLELGVSEKDIAISMQNVESEDAKANDPISPRYFFVPDARSISLSGAEELVAHPLLHPPHEDKGRRNLAPGAGVYIPDADAKASQMRLKDLGNIVIAGGSAFYTGDELDRNMPIVQWVPHTDAKSFTVHKPGVLAEDAVEGDVPPIQVVEGKIEAAALEHIGGVVQFERFGFVRIENEASGVWLHA